MSFNKTLLKRARAAVTELTKEGFVPMAGGMPPVDPAMAAAGPPMPMDPSMMGGGAPPGMPMDPAAMMGGGMPPGMPPMDPSLMSGAPPMAPGMGMAPPPEAAGAAPPGGGGGGEIVTVSLDDLRQLFSEIAGGAGAPTAEVGAEAPSEPKKSTSEALGEMSESMSRIEEMLTQLLGGGQAAPGPEAGSMPTEAAGAMPPELGALLGRSMPSVPPVLPTAGMGMGSPMDMAAAGVPPAVPPMPPGMEVQASEAGRISRMAASLRNKIEL